LADLKMATTRLLSRSGATAGSEASGTVTAADEEDVLASSEDPLSLAKILADEPPRDLLGDDDQPDARFGTRGLSKRLARVLHRSKPPFTISISGSWGVGKTTLARQVEAILDGPDVPVAERLPVVYVDLWTADVADLRRRLALEVALRLQGSDPTDEVERERKAKEFDVALRTTLVRQERPKLHIPKTWPGRLGVLAAAFVLGAAIFFLSSITVPTNSGSDPLGMRFVLAVLGPVFVWVLISSGLVFSVVNSSSSTAPLQEKVGLQHEFEKLVRSGTGRVVVIVDNLDRLPGDDAVQVLGEIRSFVEVKGSRCLFLVPLDRDALIRHLASQMNGEKLAARDYLDKFFNLDVLLTKPVRDDLREWVRDDLVGTLFDGAPATTISVVAEIVTSAADGSPRAAKRIANGIYTRAYLLPKAARGVTLPHVALVEGLVARFPGALGALMGDPRQWLEKANAFNNEGDEDTRSRQLRPLLGLAEVLEPDTKDGPEVLELLKSLRQLLVLVPDLPSEGELRTILAARSDQQWADVPSVTQVQAALGAGDGAELAKLLEGMKPAERENTVRVALDALGDDVRQKWQQGAITKVNALAPAVADDPGDAQKLERLADDLLQGGTDLNLVAQLQPSAIALLFGDGAGRLSRREQVLQSMLRELNAIGGQHSRGSAWGKIVAVVSRSNDPTLVSALIAQLGKFTEDDLKPVFEHPASAAVISALGPRYAERIAAWDANTPTEAMAETAKRAWLAKDRGWKPDAETLDKIATALQPLFPALVSEALPAIEDVTKLFADADAPTAETSAFAQALGTWPQEPLRGLELMLDIPAMPAPVVAVLNSQLPGSWQFPEFEQLGESRETMRALGVSYAEAAAKLWQARKGPQYAVLAFASRNPDDLAAFGRSLAAVTDLDAYVEMIPALAPLLDPARDEGAGRLLVTDLVGRVSTLGVERLSNLAPAVAQLAAVTNAQLVIEALKAQIGGVLRDKVPGFVACIRSFTTAGVPGSSDLPKLIATQAATVGALLPADAEWLIDQGADMDQVRPALLGAIRNQPASDVLAFTPRLRRKVEVNAFGLELVRRAAAEPVGSKTPWLLEAALWKEPGNKVRKDYEEALDQVLATEDSDEVKEAVRILRARL
jgi:hypothetical protein